MQAALRRLSSSWRGLLVAAVLVGAWSSTAHAGAFSVLWGEFDRYRDTLFVYEGQAFWTRDFGAHRLDARLEGSLGQATTSFASAHDTLWHLGLAPTLRYWLTPRTAIEYGLGANLFSGVHLGDKDIGTAFQFGNSIGVLHRFDHSAWTLGLRVTHYSNADIKRPNPGQNYLQLRASYSFD